MGEHTPGPWRVDDHGLLWSAGDVLGEVYDSTDGTANARLIAAAPDLLAALEACATEVRYACCNPIYPDAPTCAHNIARAAIASAKEDAE